MPLTHINKCYDLERKKNDAINRDISNLTHDDKTPGDRSQRKGIVAGGKVRESGTRRGNHRDISINMYDTEV